MLKVVIGFGAFLIAAAVAIGADFSVAAKGRDGYSLGDHIAARIAQVPITELQQGDLVAALPGAPEGWTMRESRPDDSFLVMGHEPTEAESDALMKLEGAYRELPGYEDAGRFYQRGDHMVLTDISFIPANARATKIARFTRDLIAAMERQSAPETVLDLNGLQFVRLTSAEFGEATYYMAMQEDGLYVSLVTNLDPTEAEAFLHGFDAPAMLAKLADDPTIGEPMLGVESSQICVRKGGKRTCQPATN